MQRGEEYFFVIHLVHLRLAFLNQILHNLQWPSWQAMQRGVIPSVAALSASAPLSRGIFAISFHPPTAAIMRAVLSFFPDKLVVVTHISVILSTLPSSELSGSLSRTLPYELAKRALAEVLFTTTTSFTAVRANPLHLLNIRYCYRCLCRLLPFLSHIYLFRMMLSDFLHSFYFTPTKSQAWNLITFCLKSIVPNKLLKTIGTSSKIVRRRRIEMINTIWTRDRSSIFPNLNKKIRRFGNFPNL